MLAISRRHSLTEGITDVLVKRGNKGVVVSTAANAGARFSEFGFSTLVERSHDDEELALKVWSRAEIPRQHLLKLFAAASETVRGKLNAADPAKAQLFLDIVRRASDQVQTQVRECSADYVAACAHIKSLHDSGRLDESQLFALAQAGMFDETTVALSWMCDLPIGVVERAIVHDNTDQILVLAKAIGLSWRTTKSIILMHVETVGSSTHQLEQCLANYNRLKPETARTAIKFYRLRERAAKPLSN